MELMSEQQFNALSENEKYNVYKDLAFGRYSSQYYWKSTVNYAKDGNLFEGIYNADFVKEIVDEAIENAEKKTLKKAFSILTSRRYTENDYVILREKDFEE